MQLFDNPLSPYAQKVRLSLYEKDLAFDKHEIFREADRDALLAVSPRGEVPALRDGDIVVYDSRVICEYLEDRYPEVALRPGDAALAARARRFELICDTQIDSAVLIFALGKFFRPDVEREHPEYFVAAGKLIDANLASLDAELAGREYVCGEISTADLALLPHLTAATFLGHPIPEVLENVNAWFARMSARASVQKLTAEVLASLEKSQQVEDPFFSNDRLHWRSDRIEAALRCGMGEWLMAELASGRGFLSPAP
ncbi:MAG: glutathione S-transferase family protein [Candidatus Binatia bacterium]